jgi:hypothetical protein
VHVLGQHASKLALHATTRTGACLFCYYLLDVGVTAIADMHQSTSLHTQYGTYAADAVHSIASGVIT